MLRMWWDKNDLNMQKVLVLDQPRKAVPSSQMSQSVTRGHVTVSYERPSRLVRRHSQLREAAPSSQMSQSVEIDKNEAEAQKSSIILLKLQQLLSTEDICLTKGRLYQSPVMLGDAAIPCLAINAS
ncbi:hypothetical protein DPMN_162319 [Dreissena polymorpha]|uniref:Uncharacterized protein n=1 Tax=Dreissena polymorpha TaxID=45954 RepID=A0A9D4EUM6_DREPO|nr:hypothetical protein DPMN_162319 [Dreissena polymorpha]